MIEKKLNAHVRLKSGCAVPVKEYSTEQDSLLRIIAFHPQTCEPIILKASELGELSFKRYSDDLELDALISNALNDK